LITPQGFPYRLNQDFPRLIQRDKALIILKELNHHFSGGKTMSEMTKVESCTKSDCVFNQNSQCHAQAINIGDEFHPDCDSYIQGSKKAGDPDTIAGVGVCKCSSCEYNESFECQAGEITVGEKSREVECLTYEAKAEVLTE
jgi:hypothetical protein